jgi:hypothetical protein
LLNDEELSLFSRATQEALTRVYSGLHLNE